MEKTEEFLNIEEEFFDVDHKSQCTHVQLEFHRPADIFDQAAITKTPVLNDDFMEWIAAAYEHAPRKYKIDLEVSFEDMDGYSEEKMNDIFRKNVVLAGKRSIRKAGVKNRIALGLVGVGVVLLVSMIFLLGFWKDGGIAKEIVSYIFDIATTVTLWEALTILLVENKERRDLHRDLARRFASIRFHQKVSG